MTNGDVEIGDEIGEACFTKAPLAGLLLGISGLRWRAVGRPCVFFAEATGGLRTDAPRCSQPRNRGPLAALLL